MAVLLRVDKVSKAFGGYRALDDVAFEIEGGRIHSLIGPNGAGKTTLFNIISGLMRPNSGRVIFADRDYTGRRAHRVLGMGIARNFQQVRLFKGLSVVENVMIGCHARIGYRRWADVLRFARFAHDAERRAEDRSKAMLEFVGLDPRTETLPLDLTLADQRRLEIARALASEPKLLLLDEPAAGMNPTELAEIGQLIRRICDAGVTVLLVEHNMRLVMNVAERISVLSAGTIIAEGPPVEIQQDEAVIAAYLGSDDEPVDRR